MSDPIRDVSTGQYRFRLKGRWFRDPLIILQMEYRREQHKDHDWTFAKWIVLGEWWGDVTLEHLTTMGLQALTQPREAGDFPICFKPLRTFLRRWCLVLQVCDGAYKDNQWRPARVQDLTMKDGRIQGGLGLIRR